VPRFIVPKQAGQCFVRTGPTGKPTVYNNQSGNNRICIPCNTRAEAEKIRDRLNSGDHQGEINIPN